MFRCYQVANNPDRIHLLLEEGVKDILVSYAYARRAKGYLEGMKVAAKKGVKLLIDSGAHSNIQHPGTVVLKEYMVWLKENKHLAHEYIVLDDPLKRENTIKAYAEMRSAGLSPLAVDHMWFKVAPQIMPWYTKGGRLCWAGFLIGDRTPMGQWAKNEEVQKKMPEGYASHFQTTAQWLAVAKRIHERRAHAMKAPVNRIHLLGVGSAIRKFLPYLDAVDSFDAASVFIAAGYGRVILCRAPKHEGGPPRCSGFPVGRGRPTPPEVKVLASKWKLNLDVEVDRRRFNIREMRKFHEVLWEYYQREHKKGHDHLVAMSIKKSDEDDDLYPSRPLIVQVPIALSDAWGEWLELEEMEEVCAQARMKVSDVSPTRISKMPDPSLLLLHEEIHLAPLEAAGLREAHLFIVQEMAKRGLTHALEEVDLLAVSTRELAAELGLVAEELETLGLVEKQMVIQSLILSKDKFKTQAEVTKWIKDHGFTVLKGDEVEITKPGVDETTQSWRVRQRDPEDFQPGSFRTIDIADGVKAVVGKLKPGVEKSDGDLFNPVIDLFNPVMHAKLLPVDKADEDRRLVLGVVLEPNSVDTQGDTIAPEEIERAAHLWLARFQDRGFMHRQIVNSKLEIYESYLAPADLTIGGQRVKKGSWLLMYHVVDDVLWAAVKRGDLTGFSMGGFARRVAA